MHRPTAVVRREHAAGQLHGLQRTAAQKQQQHAAPTDVVGAQPRIAEDTVEPEYLLVERTGAFERVDIQTGFQNAEQIWHNSTYFVIPGPSEARSPESIFANA